MVLELSRGGLLTLDAEALGDADPSLGLFTSFPEPTPIATNDDRSIGDLNARIEIEAEPGIYIVLLGEIQGKQAEIRMRATLIEGEKSDVSSTRPQTRPMRSGWRRQRVPSPGVARVMTADGAKYVS